MIGNTIQRDPWYLVALPRCCGLGGERSELTRTPRALRSGVCLVIERIGDKTADGFGAYRLVGLVFAPTINRLYQVGQHPERDRRRVQARSPSACFFSNIGCRLGHGSGFSAAWLCCKAKCAAERCGNSPDSLDGSDGVQQGPPLPAIVAACLRGRTQKVRNIPRPAWR
jgi:hypothetical protein